ncbi:hypothetical protein PhCBS80983_g02896 [Powellomyces hirtus]|uniref:Uncharacterized protein n=1 Tax=Powellomyces hirtus TaxID=109895 RepID=A0A507E6S7_9FUNG|nr:hypothetical protein PhCBS80983_g02896 [Powellomyces hirtus]
MGSNDKFAENLLATSFSQEAHALVFPIKIEHHHKNSIGVEAIAGAAAFEAMKDYERHVAANGTPRSHHLMKELLTGFAAAEVDKLFETKGLDWLDRERARNLAINEAHKLADEQYGPGNVQPNGYFLQHNQDVHQ